METMHNGEESITRVVPKEANNESQNIRRTVRFKSEDEAYSANTTPILSPDSQIPLCENEPKIVSKLCLPLLIHFLMLIFSNRLLY